MRDLPATRRQRLIDVVLAAGIAIPGLVALLWSSPGPVSGLPCLVLLLALGASVLVRRRWPVSAAVVASVACIVAVQTGSFDPNRSSVAAALLTFALLGWVVVTCYTLGGARPLGWSAAGLVSVIVATQWDDLNHDFNPFPSLLAIGLWTAGRIVASRRDVIAALDARGRELADERRRYAAEAVRYERARIARELHDVIAHCMSIIVVQASAGQLLDRPDDTDQVLRDIGDLARQAESDLSGLSRLLTREPRPVQTMSREEIDQFIAHAGSAGTLVQLTISGDLDAITATAAATLNRVLQEGLTNAIKHAPGASVTVDLRIGPEATAIEIHNAAAQPSPQPLDIPSGHNGIQGLHQRVSELGGTLHAQPTPTGGWRLSATIPTTQRPALSQALSGAVGQ